MGQNLRAQLEPVARTIAEQVGVSPDLFVRLITQESGWDSDVIYGNRKSSAGAEGIGQFMPGTAQQMGIDPLNPEQALWGAAKYLRQNYDLLGNWGQAVAAYNAGPGAIQNLVKEHGDLWGSYLPAETKQYLGSIFSLPKAGGGGPMGDGANWTDIAGGVPIGGVSPVTPSTDATGGGTYFTAKDLQALWGEGTTLKKAWDAAATYAGSLSDDDPGKDAAESKKFNAKAAYESWAKQWDRAVGAYKLLGGDEKAKTLPPDAHPRNVGAMTYITDNDGHIFGQYMTPKDDAEARALGYLNFRLSAYSKLLEYGDIDEKQAQQHYQNEVAAYNQKIAAYREQREGTKNEYDMKRNQVQDDLNAWKDYLGATGEAAKLAFQTFQQVQPFLTSSQGPVQLSSMAPGGAMNQLYDTLGLKYQAPNPIGVMDVPDFTGPLKAAIGKMPQQTSVAPMQIPDFLSSVGPAPSAPPMANHDEQQQAVSFIKSLLGIQ